MVLADLPRVLLRRWYVVLIGLLGTAAIGVLAFHASPPSYTSTAEVLLLPPATSVPAGGNPYLLLGGLDVAGDILAKSMSSDSSAAALMAAGASGKFSVALDRAGAAPMVLVTAETSSLGASRTTLGLVVNQIPSVLARVQDQAGVPQNARITSTVLTETMEPAKSLKPVLRTVGGAVAGGLVGTLLLTALVDAIIVRLAGSHRFPDAKRDGSRSVETAEDALASSGLREPPETPGEDDTPMPDPRPERDEDDQRSPLSPAVR